MSNGRQLNPLWPLSGFVQNESDGASSLTFCMMTGLQGGGPIKLMTSRQVEDSGNFRDIAHMEEDNFEGALAVALQMIIRDEHGAMRCDISDFLLILGINT